MDRIELSGLMTQDAAAPVVPLRAEDLPHFRTGVDAFSLGVHTSGLRFGEPPFVLPEGPTPAALADSLTFAFYKMRDSTGPLLSLLWRLVSAFAMTMAPLLALREAGERIAADQDRGVGLRPSNAFHTPHHTAETLLTAHVLALVERHLDHALFPEARLLLVLAALIHGWHHDGGRNGGTPFLQENRAWEAAQPYLADLSPAQRIRLLLILRATDPEGGRTFLRDVLLWHARERRGPAPTPPAGYDALAPLLQPEHTLTADLAGILCDAETLPLFGLTADYAVLMSRALQDEWAQPLIQKDYVAHLDTLLGRPRRPSDTRPPLHFEGKDRVAEFFSPAGQFFNASLPDVISGHGALLGEMGEDGADPEEARKPRGVDLSVLSTVRGKAEETLGSPPPPLTSLESIATLRATLQNAGYFDDPPFATTPRGLSTLLPGLKAGPALHVTLAEQSADSLMRLHGVTGPLLSALVMQLFDSLGLRVDDPVYRAAAGIARQIDEGIGAGTLGDVPDGDRNPYHNRNHIVDLLLLSHLLGLRAAQRTSAASSPLARGLALLSALVCHWHHDGRGNRVDGEYRIFHLQDRAIAAAEPYTAEMSRELRQSLEIIVRSTDPRTPYAFSRSAYSYHVGLEARPDVPNGCEPLVRLLADPALCTLATRLNDVIYAPFVGLGPAFSARSLVQFGRETGQALDFGFVRKSLIGPLLSRPLYQGETPPKALRSGANRIASFTSAEAQALFNPAMHALLLLKEGKA